MAGQDYYAERSEAKEDEAEDGVDQAEEGRPNAVGRKRTTTISVVNQAIRPAATIRIPHLGALEPKTVWARGSQLEVTPTQ